MSPLASPSPLPPRTPRTHRTRINADLFPIYLLLPAMAMATCRGKPLGSVFDITKVASWGQLALRRVRPSLGWKELRILNRTLRWCKDGSVFAANLRHGREVVDELGLSKSKPVSSPATGDGFARCQDDESKPLDEDEKRLYQRIIAKLNYLAHDRLDLKYATSCLASVASSPRIGDVRAAKEVGRYLRKAPVAWQGFPFHDPRPEELLCYTDAAWASDKTSRRSTSGGVVTLGGGVLNCWAKKQNSVAMSSWE